MKVLFRKRFLKDLARIPPDYRKRIEKFAFEELPAAGTILATGRLQQLEGHTHFYRARFGVYRLGLQKSQDGVTLERVLHRKDIYRRFP